MIDAQRAGDGAAHHDGLQVFQRLQRGADGVLVVAHLHASAHSLDVGVEVERQQYLLNGVAVQGRVGVEVHDVFSPRIVGAEVGCAGLAATHVQPEVAADKAATFQVGVYLRRGVVRPVVHNDDLIVPVRLFLQRLQQGVDVLALVLTGHEDGDERIVLAEHHGGILVGTHDGLPCGAAVEGHEDFRQVIAGKLDEEQEPIGVQDARDGQPVQVGHERIQRVEDIVHKPSSFLLPSVYHAWLERFSLRMNASHWAGSAEQ